MKAIAILTVRNEQRFITQCIAHLHAQGIETIVVDNQSTDDTVALAWRTAHLGLKYVLTLPFHNSFNLVEILANVERLSYDIDADWFMHVDADEFHEPIDRNGRLIDVIKKADSDGYNAINFIEYAFFPTSENPNHDHAYFQDTMNWYYAYCPSQYRRVNAWKKRVKIDLVSGAGHCVNFDGLKIYPANQVMRHYICLSKQHAIEKFCRRTFAQDEVTQRGWHGERPYIDENKISFPNATSMSYWANRSTALDSSQPRSKHFFEAWSNRQQYQAKNAIRAEGVVQNAEPSKKTGNIEMRNEVVQVDGTQAYTLTRYMPHPSPDDVLLCKKHELLKNYLSPAYLKNCTLTDFGASGGFFCFWALSQQAQCVNALDTDDENIQAIEQLNSFWGGSNLKIVKANWHDWKQEANVVLAFDLYKWIHGPTTTSHTLDDVINKLATLTRDILIFEWSDYKKTTSNSFLQPNSHKESKLDICTHEHVEQALRKYFARCDCIGEVTSARKLYVAHKNNLPIDRTCPLPLKRPIEQVIYSRVLCKHNNIDYWSMIYDCKEKYLKQTSLDLAFREGSILAKLDGNEGYFPKAYEFAQGAGYSTVLLERINGDSLQAHAQHFQVNPSHFIQFTLHLLKILQILKENQIVHRDIRADNIIVRNHKPVLIDFGWAEMSHMPNVTPTILGHNSRPADKRFCDVYSTGKLLQEINRGHYKEIDLILNLMIAEDPTLRLIDLNILTNLFHVVGRAYAN